MGTRLEMILVGLPRTGAWPLWERIRRDAAAMEAVFDRFDPSSEVALVNASGDPDGGVELGGILADAVTEAMEYWKRTGCLFDITRGAGECLSLREGNRLLLRGADLDFGGFAKGYLLRRIRDLLREEGVGNAFVDFGSSAILALGSHPHGDCWSVDVSDPFHAGEVLARVELRDRALSTSGNLPGYAGHIIHPRTGVPCRERKVVTVVAEDPLDAEVLSTALMVASPAEETLLRDHFPDADMQIHEITR